LAGSIRLRALNLALCRAGADLSDHNTRGPKRNYEHRTPTPPRRVKVVGNRAKNESDYGGSKGYQIRYNFSYTIHMKTAISIPDATFRAAETLAKRLGVSRSQLYRRALEKFMDAERRSEVTEKLNDIYVSESSELDPVLSEIQITSFPPEEW